MKINKIENIFFYNNKSTDIVTLQFNNGERLQVSMNYAPVASKEVIKGHISENVDSKSRMGKAKLRVRDIEAFHPEAHMFYHGHKEGFNVDVTYDNRSGRTSIIVREVLGNGKRDVVLFGTFASVGTTAKLGSIRKSCVSLLNIKSALSCAEAMTLKMVGKWEAAALANKVLTQTDLPLCLRNILKNEKARAAAYKALNLRERNLEDKAFELSLSQGNDIPEAMVFAAAVNDMVNDAREEATVEAADKANEEVKPTLMQEMLSDNKVVELVEVVITEEVEPIVVEEIKEVVEPASNLDEYLLNIESGIINKYAVVNTFNSKSFVKDKFRALRYEVDDDLAFVQMIKDTNGASFVRIEDYVKAVKLNKAA